METFVIKTEQFEGPIELLLRLVEERKLHISLVSLAAVTDSFLQQVEKLPAAPAGGPENDRDTIANFILVAATLMLIKSVNLLPTIPVTAEEKESMVELEERLRQHRRTKELSGHVAEKFGRSPIFFRQPSRAIKAVFAPSAELTLDNLVTVLKSVIAALPQIEKLPLAVVKKVLALEEVISNLTRRIQQTLKTSFKEFTKNQTERVNVIISFLGMLELVKQGIIAVEQSANFADIAIESSEPRTPRYG